jgi:hypothetical protein
LDELFIVQGKARYTESTSYVVPTTAFDLSNIFSTNVYASDKKLNMYQVFEGSTYLRIRGEQNHYEFGHGNYSFDFEVYIDKPTSASTDPYQREVIFETSVAKNGFGVYYHHLDEEIEFGPRDEHGSIQYNRGRISSGRYTASVKGTKLTQEKWSHVIIQRIDNVTTLIVDSQSMPVRRSGACSDMEYKFIARTNSNPNWEGDSSFTFDVTTQTGFKRETESSVWASTTQSEKVLIMKLKR